MARRTFIASLTLGLAGCSAAKATKTELGSALESSYGDGAEMGDEHRRVGDRVYYLSPTLTNRSKDPITVTAVSGVASGPGLAFIESRIYSTTDFGNEVVLLWTPASREGSDPKQVPSSPATDIILQPGQTFDSSHFILVEMQIRQAGRWQSNGVTVKYQQRGHTRVQTFGTTLVVVAK